MTLFQNPLIMDHLLHRSPVPPEPVCDFETWKTAWLMLSPHWDYPIDRALAGGLASDRPSWAFASGYQAAIQYLAGESGGGGTAAQIGAVCITETGGAHPSAIRSRLKPVQGSPGYWELNGEKTFISGGEQSDFLWVAASVGTTGEGRNNLRMVRVSSKQPGVSFSVMKPLGLVPEMPHASALFKAVVISDADMLHGDGYLTAVKPFRTLEDIHVTAAFLAFLFGIGRRSTWNNQVLETLLFLIAGIRSLAASPPLAAHTHLALGGLLDQVKHLIRDTDPLWATVDAATRRRWHRDRKVLDIAGSARSKRRETAWRKV